MSNTRWRSELNAIITDMQNKYINQAELDRIYVFRNGYIFELQGT